MLNLAAQPFIQAKCFTPALRLAGDISVIVIHVMEMAEKPDTAERCAQYFASMSDGRVASAHWCVDADSTVHCVQHKDVAYGAPGANRNGIHIEHAGKSDQSAADWQDAYSQAMLKRSAELVAALCQTFGLPVQWLSPADLAAGKKGITSHNNVSLWQQSIGKPGTHTDPGPGFPVQQYLNLIRSFKGS